MQKMRPKLQRKNKQDKLDLAKSELVIEEQIEVMEMKMKKRVRPKMKAKRELLRNT